MNAQELTIEYNKMSNELRDLRSDVDFMQQELEHLRLFLDDARLDIKILYKEVQDK